MSFKSLDVKELELSSINCIPVWSNLFILLIGATAISTSVTGVLDYTYNQGFCCFLVLFFMTTLVSFVFSKKEEYCVRMIDSEKTTVYLVLYRVDYLEFSEIINCYEIK